MRLGVLFSGGKDSCLALYKARNEAVCLITVVSKNPESYMFHTPNIRLTELQAEAIGLPLVSEETEGRKEEELADLKAAILKAKEKYGIEGVVTGAVESAYQSSRVASICAELGLACLNPLWKRNAKELLESLLKEGFKVIISGVFAPPLDKSWLGKELDTALMKRLLELQKTHGISPVGEGGEIETTVLDAPFFRKRIEILESEARADKTSAVLIIKKARLVQKA
ncbi:MAG: diphthine--ammonia ligase [Candidatus Aenigmatarchaeota archaeon]